MIDFEKPYQKRLREFESFDKITMEVVPRFKTSGLSGDEWRTSVAMKFWFKGVEVYSAYSHDMRTALLLIGHRWIEQQEPIPNEVIRVEKSKCAQPGCSEGASRKFRLKREYSRSGELLDASESSPGNGLGPMYRQFCENHAERGNSSMEDRDENYEEMK